MSEKCITNIDNKLLGDLIGRVNSDELNSLIILSAMITENNSNKYNGYPAYKTLQELLIVLQDKYQIFLFSDNVSDYEKIIDVAYILTAAMIILLKAYNEAKIPP